MTKNELTDIPGIGAAAADLLQKAGFEMATDIAKASPKALSAVKGFGPARAARVIEAAQSLTASLPEPEANSSKADSNAPAEPQAPATPKKLEEAKEKEAAPQSKPAVSEKTAATTKPTAAAKPASTTNPAESATPAVSVKPAARPAPTRQPSVARGAAFKRLVREPWYLVGFGIALMVGAGFAQQSGLIDPFGPTESPVEVGTDEETDVLSEAPEEQQPDSVPETGAAGVATAETPDEQAAQASPQAEQPRQYAKPESAVPAVYRPFAYGYGPASEWAQGRADGSLVMNFYGRQGLYGYPQWYSYYGPAPFALPHPVAGPYQAFPGIGTY